MLRRLRSAAGEKRSKMSRAAPGRVNERQLGPLRFYTGPRVDSASRPLAFLTSAPQQPPSSALRHAPGNTHAAEESGELAGSPASPWMQDCARSPKISFYWFDATLAEVGKSFKYVMLLFTDVDGEHTHAASCPRTINRHIWSHLSLNPGR